LTAETRRPDRFSGLPTNPGKKEMPILSRGDSPLFLRDEFRPPQFPGDPPGGLRRERGNLSQPSGFGERRDRQPDACFIIISLFVPYLSPDRLLN